jgi:hypothetical protein
VQFWCAGDLLGIVSGITLVWRAWQYTGDCWHSIFLVLLLRYDRLQQQQQRSSSWALPELLCCRHACLAACSVTSEK